MSTSTEQVPVPEWDLADRLGKALRVADMTAGEMAVYLGVHRNTVSAWLNGRTPISGPAVRAWADRTGVDYDWLITGRANTPQPPKLPFTEPQTIGAVRRLHPATDVVTEDRPPELAAMDDDAVEYLRLADPSEFITPSKRVRSNSQPVGVLDTTPPAAWMAWAA